MLSIFICDIRSIANNDLQKFVSISQNSLDREKICNLIDRTIQIIPDLAGVSGRSEDIFDFSWQCFWKMNIPICSYRYERNRHNTHSS
jgi:hypothetical protein